MKLRRLFLLMVTSLGFAIPAMAQDATAEATGEAMSLEYVVNLSSTEELGDFFVDANGMTLYTFDRDTLNTSNCSGECLVAWPALIVESEDAITADESIPGIWSTFTRDDGTLQVVYNGWPLYYWFRDTVAGDTTGQAVGKVWWVASPATVALVPTEMGPVLSSDTGMTLYLFTNDEIGVSNCYEQCAANWPPYLVESADDLLKGANIGGALGTIERTDGTLQVTYNGWPLYYWAKDEAIGDTTGHMVGDVWFAIAPETVVTAEQAEVGPYLTAPNGFTLYIFAKDTAGVSNCVDTCQENWPPYTVASADGLWGDSDAQGELGTIERTNGRLQVTYNGMPLYYFAEDKVPGDATGHNPGGNWVAASP